jgi:hypothetical protein
MDRWHTREIDLEQGDHLPPSAQKIEGFLKEHLTADVLREIAEFSIVFGSLQPMLYGGYDEIYGDVPVSDGDEEVRVVYRRKPPYNLPAGQQEFFQHLQMDYQPDIQGSTVTATRPMLDRVQKELESMRNDTLRDDGKNVD